ncbi:MAG: FAD-dependent oxidoreductase [Thermodesulfobacteriota bacterium]|nr:FAD-dependent oxidoreductase [Thermodesulfobacteriota bacterium]
MEFPRLLSPIKINSLELRNRIVMTAAHVGFSTSEGEVTDRLIDFYTHRAEGGVGLIIVGGSPVDEHISMPNMVRIDHDRYVPGLKRLTDRVKEAGAGVFIQLCHVGRYIHSSMINGEKALAPSAVYSPFTGETPRALELEEIQVIQGKFAEDASRAKEAGFDGVEIHGSAGYLVSQFLSPLTNQRTDKYGGSVENRMRFVVETVEKIQQAVGPDFPIGMRIPGNEMMKGGNTLKEAKHLAVRLEEAGIGYLNVTIGWHESRVPQVNSFVPRGCYVYAAQEVKAAVSLPVLTCNRINDPALAESILRQGSADMTGMARALIADPDLPNKLMEGRERQINHCIACNQGCYDKIFSFKPVTCLVNPRVGMEKEWVPSPAEKPKRLLVIGGGPAGLKAACTAAERGHRVWLAEKSGRLGGQFLLNRNIPGREELVTLVKDLTDHLHDLSVDILLDKEADRQFVQELSPDVVVVGTGARPLFPDIKGGNNENVVHAWDVLSGKADVGKRVVIIGGNAVGLETALYLAHIGTLSPEALHFLVVNRAESWDSLEQLVSQGIKQVTVVELTRHMGKDIGSSTRWTVMAELKRLGVSLLKNTKAVAVHDRGIDILADDKTETLEADSVVIAAGSESENTLLDEIEGLVPEIHIIGDAKEPRKAIDAVREGFLVGLTI